jgi:hypothetical protein
MSSKPLGSSVSHRMRVSTIRNTAIAVALALVGTLSAGTGANALPPDNGKCSFGIFIGVRGTIEPAGSQPGLGGRTWQSGGLGATSTLAADFQLDQELPSYIESLNYPATAFGPDYYSSLEVGKTRLREEIESIAVQCPYTNIILAGYSQGAHVIGDVMAPVSGPVLSASAKNAISGVIFFGDIAFRPNKSFNATGSGTGIGTFQRSDVSSNGLAAYTRYIYATPQSTSPTNVPIIRSYCLPGDQFCQMGTGANAAAIHASYLGNATIQNDAYFHLRRFLIDNG